MAGLWVDRLGHLVIVAAVGYAHEPMTPCAGIARHAVILPMHGLLLVEPVGDPNLPPDLRRDPRAGEMVNDRA